MFTDLHIGTNPAVRRQAVETSMATRTCERSFRRWNRLEAVASARAFRAQLSVCPTFALLERRRSQRAFRRAAKARQRLCRASWLLQNDMN